MTTRCTEDKWAADGRELLRDDGQGHGLDEEVPRDASQDQQPKLMTEIRAVMMGAAGPAVDRCTGGGAPSGGEAPEVAHRQGSGHTRRTNGRLGCACDRQQLTEHLSQRVAV